MKHKFKTGKVLRTIILAILIFLLLFPLAVMINSSLKSYDEIRAWPPTWFEGVLRWKNYQTVVSGNQSIMGPFFNSLQISLVTMFLCVFVGILAAYAVTRFNFKGRKTFLMVVIATQMFSSVILVNPIYVIFRNLGLLDTKISLIIANTASSLPMTIWLLYSYFSQIPKDYEEASWMDGSSRFQGIFKVVMPLALPGIITAGLFAFVTAWGDLVYAKSFVLSPELRTVSQALTDFQDLYKTTWETQMAASVVTTIPPFIIFMFIQKYLIKGMISQGVKG